MPVGNILLSKQSHLRAIFQQVQKSKEEKNLMHHGFDNQFFVEYISGWKAVLDGGFFLFGPDTLIFALIKEQF